MKLSACFSSSEIKLSSIEGLHHLNATQRPCIKTSKCTWNGSHGGKRLAICSHLMPGHLDGAFVGKKEVEEPRKKLEYVRTLLVDNYDSYTYNIYQELSIINGVPPTVTKNDSWTWDEIIYYLYEEKAFDNVVISPGPGSPSCPADIGICLKLLHECRDIPILGVCLGHQALGYVHGAQVVHAPEPVHGRLSEIEHDGSRLFSEIPSGGDSGFKVVRYHSLAIDAETLPEELVPIAWTSSGDAVSFSKTQSTDVVLDAYGHLRQQVCGDSLSKVINGKSQPRHSEDRQSKKVLMAVKHSNRPHYGVQFHPESVATCYGRQIFKNFRKITEDYWLKSRSSIFKGKSAKSIVRLQVSHADHLLRQVHLRNESFGDLDIMGDQLFQEASFNRLLAYGMDDRSSLGLSGRQTISHARTAVKFLKLRWRKFEGIATKLGGAENIFCKLFGDDKADNTFWLDSASTEKGRARFSFMGGRGGPLWKQLTFRLTEKSDEGSRGGGYLSVENARGSITTSFLEEGFLDFLNTELQSYHCEEKDYEGLPFGFYGGFVGYIGYNLKAECGVTSNYHKSKTPDACFFFADNVIAIDHLNNDVYLMSVHDGYARETSWLDDIEKKLLSLEASSKVNSKDQIKTPPVLSPSEAGFLCEKSKEEYMKDVEKSLKYIKDGESYELCLTTQMRKEIGDIDYLGLYRHLRQKNPAPYAAWLNFSKEKLCICCSSPERFLRLDRHGVLEAKPIKGTIARGSTKELDHQNKLQLQYSEKDQAENLMIVDLLRNDLGRVCDPGSVHVPHLMDIESYATVHTMVSTVRGNKQSHISAVDCVRAAFPGGSMTGAPKLRSMELLDSLESCSRDIYSGSLGFFSINQTFDLNIVIRTIVIYEGEASIGAGGAIVALSKPEDEYDEMILKTRAPVNAVMEYENSA